MRIHTDVLTAADFYAAIEDGSGVWVDECNERGSQSRARAFEVRLAAEPKKGRRRKRNSGQYGADALVAATYDEHGEWMARLFDIDPEAVFTGVYDGAQDFHTKTNWKYGE